ncbi:AFG1-like ATPase-domain-containing protein [Biscogniauxia mediterranea]|nr:AFG1-like ATPase-domain-containing protein [Biscogniauxia mediterranea]
MKHSISSLAITDPLVKYQSLLATGLCCPDAAQHRLALHLQKVYYRLKDYSPSVEYRARLKAITSALDRANKNNASSSSSSPPALAVESHPIWRNPLFARFFGCTDDKDPGLALTKVLTSHEEAIQINSPQGLFLSGEVGTGKSMLLDLLADGLPTSRKRRWHFNTFMLYTLSQLERHRKMHAELDSADQQYSLFWLAKEMVEKSPIFFLDEFQLPDRAASKILSNLFTAFFQLGGVLVASSNRMPEELEKATGFAYVAPPRGGLIGRALGLGRSLGRGELFGSSSDFASFLEVLKARCEFWQMEGGTDWRRRDTSKSSTQSSGALADTSVSQSGTKEPMAQIDHEVDNDENMVPPDVITVPKNYFILGQTDESSWKETIANIAMSLYVQGDIPWQPLTLTVYGRSITIPEQHDGVVRWDFNDLVASFGPADYITMASTFHTFIIDNVPVLTILKKNEARRLITLLDALYEARCKLVIRAEVGPDDLFFPESKKTPTTAPIRPPTTDEGEENLAGGDAIHSETIAEAYQDHMSPFRPNISSYDASGSPHTSSYDEDADFDFGLDHNHPHPHRLQGQNSNTNTTAAGVGVVDFSNTSAFTGEDERFAYKRAASRLWELCGARWHARAAGPGWWQPLPREARHWEGGEARSRLLPPSRDMSSPGGEVEAMGPSIELDEPAGLQRLRVAYLRKREERKKGGRGARKGGDVR